MKRLLTLALLATFIGLSVGCANGPIRRWFGGGACDTCNPPAFDPGYGVSSSCPNGSCQSGYMGDGLIQSDPYMQGSSTTGASINPPLYDGNSGTNYGGTIVPPASTLPGPAGGG